MEAFHARLSLDSHFQTVRTLWLVCYISRECNHGGMTVDEDVVVTRDAGAGLLCWA